VAGGPGDSVTLGVMENDIATIEPVETAADGTNALVEEELLVEEISIDGMCGVY
jgi:mycofactocin precursor